MSDRPFSLDRLKAVIHYIAWKEPGISRLKLRSLLYLIDLQAYLHLGKSITGATYRRGKQTVIVQGLSRALRSLRDEGKIS